MRRVVFVGCSAAAAALAVLPVGLAETAQSDERVIVGVVGPGFTIDLQTEAGTHVSRLTPGRYTLIVRDHSSEHNFVLANKPDGQRVRVDSGVEFVGVTRFVIELFPAQYAYACSPHFQTMNGHLLVRADDPAPAASRRPLRATVQRGGAISILPRSASPGRRTLVVTDRSPSANFHLVGPGVDRKTTRRFVGTVSWLVSLRKGTYRYGSDPRLRGVFRVR